MIVGVNVSPAAFSSSFLLTTSEWKAKFILDGESLGNHRQMKQRSDLSRTRS
jgi:hypothetical protein